MRALNAKAVCNGQASLYYAILYLQIQGKSERRSRHDGAVELIRKTQKQTNGNSSRLDSDGGGLREKFPSMLMFLAKCAGVLERKLEAPRRAYPGKTAAIFFGSTRHRLRPPAYPLASTIAPARSAVPSLVAADPRRHCRHKARGICREEVDRRRGNSLETLSFNAREFCAHVLG
jgi:hypothetical protein